MAKDFAKSFYNSASWQKCRKTYIAYRKSVDGGMCETCHEVLGYIVHHRTELTPYNINDPEIALDFRNLKYDCQECHNKEHGKENIPGLVQYDFTEDGQIIETRTPPLK